MKKLPDCRNRAPNVPGARRWVTSIASAPRLAPMPTGSPSTGTASRRPGMTSTYSAREYSADAEYHSSRGPGESSATRCGGSVPAAIMAPA